MKLSTSQVKALAAQFVPSGIDGEPEPYGGGHINDTFLFRLDESDGAQYILQRINKNAFPNPDQVMENMLRVTEYLRGQIALRGGNPDRETLHLLKTGDDQFFAVDENGDYWRAYSFISNSVSFDRSEDEDLFRESGKAFGRFLSMLDGFDAPSLHETIVRFHDTPNRYAAFHQAIQADRAGRADSVRQEINACLRYEGFASTLVDGLARGTLPLRVTHNDTKLNNVLMDAETRKAVCVIDLDTVMPGLSAYDFGDAIRYGASTAAEDEPDLSKVHFSLSLYRAFAEGYLGEVARNMTPAEVDSLPVGAKMMTLESAVRFLTDYLNGDVYFKTAYPEHNLVRSRTQIKLVEEMDANWDEMLSIVRELAGKD